MLSLLLIVFVFFVAGVVLGVASGRCGYVYVLPRNTTAFQRACEDHGVSYSAKGSDGFYNVFYVRDLTKMYSVGFLTSLKGI